MKHNSIRFITLTLIIFSLGLISFTTYKASVMSFTHDESLTVLRAVPKSFMQVVSYATIPPRANNHIINTLLIKACLVFSEPNDFIIRFPNIIAHAFYLIFSILIARKIKNPILAISGFILINFNPFMLDFFSMARGYGLSYTFLIASLYYLILYIEKPKLKYIWSTLILAAFGVLSQFVLLHFYLALIAVLNLLFITDITKEQISIKRKINKLFKRNIPLIFITLVQIAILFEPIRKLTKQKELYGHGLRSFWDDTIISFFHMSLYDKKYMPYFPEKLGVIFLSLISIAVIISIVIFLKRQKTFSSSYIQVLPLLLFISGLTPVLQHHILGSQYLDIRLTVWYIPLIGLTILFIFESLTKIKNLRIVGYILSILFSSLFFMHTVNSVNDYSVKEWVYDSSTKELVSDLEKIKDENNLEKVDLGITWLFEPTINYYREINNLEWLNEVDRDGILAKEFTYYYIHESDKNSHILDSLEIIKRYPNSNTVLAKGKN